MGLNKPDHGRLSFSQHSQGLALTLGYNVVINNRFIAVHKLGITKSDLPRRRQKLAIVPGGQ